MNNRYEQHLGRLRDEGNERTLRTVAPHSQLVDYGGRTLVNLSSNDYLGVAGRDDLRSKFLATHDLEQLMFGSTSARLLSGTSPWHTKLETSLSEAYGRPALTFVSGYHANVGILPALTGKNDLIVADKLVHASTIDGFRLSDAKLMRYRHLDYEHLRRTLLQHRGEFENVFIVTESIFSMDGDEADLRRLVEIKREFGAMLYVDEAHSVGVRGRRGLGLCEEQQCLDEVDFFVGTFGKAYGSVGAFVVCSELHKKYLINTQRTFIFSTALPPINAAWTDFILSQMSDFDALRQKLQTKSDELRNLLTEKGLPTRGTSHIVPLICGANDAALELSDKLCKAGFFALAVRHPTVPMGEARIRFSLNASLDDAHYDDLFKYLRTL